MRKRLDKGVALLIVCTMLTLSACGKEESAKQCNCSCEGCNSKMVESTETASLQEYATDIVLGENTSESIPNEEDITSEVFSEVDEESAVTENEPDSVEVVNQVSMLSPEQKAARRQLQENLRAEREKLYAQPTSIQKTQLINQIDKQILENNTYDFSGKTIQFIGDSITEGIGGDKDSEGRFISYTKYANDYLCFGQCMNAGKGGRMFSDFGEVSDSLVANLDTYVYNGADIYVVFLGVNDFLANNDDKRFGDRDYNSVSPSGYSGSLRSLMKFFNTYFQGREIFFVTTYRNNMPVAGYVSDMAVQPTLNDYMNQLRGTVNTYGYHMIELHDTGFMDCTDANTASVYLKDGIHPNNEGNIIIGQHIAAELSLYFGEKQ